MSKEIKVALLAIVAIAALVIGYNFLRGTNVLSDDRTYYATYPNVEGLNVGAQVILNGIKVGQVKNLELQPERGNAVRASLELQKGIVVGDSTVAGLSGTLLGSKTITLFLGKNNKEFNGGEELVTKSAISTIDAFQAKALPVLDTVGATLAHINAFLNQDAQTNIQGTLRSARQSTEALQALIAANQRNINQITTNLAQMSSALNKSTTKLDRIANNFSQLSDSLKSAPVGPALRRLDATMAEAQTTVASLNRALNDQKGSMGKLINDTLLYNNLNATAASSNALISDFKANPKRYVHFSVFGGGKDKKKTEVETTVTRPNGTTVDTETKTTVK
ncbi:MlaD family protein [Hymenobacter arizonensis]|uniref:Phospholipid/cholesterol/gamma-HCH transport system substrate-binding protein n=1 Tax=Hymenobacter arizonensis TaxID=1227077 RepID=A0A1I6B0C7_HYMAR|nr:MlaD family protein [Hymenobacter arizonensis]SFQ74323.1 phospholipid/cholesterol/gamma-HCH transport system substrate-binding protein [Hymenobacter arizonensis]